MSTSKSERHKHVSVRTLDRWMEIVHDLKKEITYNKCEGKWYWRNRHDDSPSDPLFIGTGPFDHYVDAVHDIVEPYINMKDP